MEEEEEEEERGRCLLAFYYNYIICLAESERGRGAARLWNSSGAE